MKRYIVSVLLLIALAYGCIAVRDAGKSESAGAGDTQMPQMRVHFLNLSHGQCTVCELPNGECMIADCGSQEDFPAVYEYVRKLGIESVSSLAITYADSFHMGGAKKLIQNLKVKAMYVPPYIEDKRLYENTVSEARGFGCEIVIARAGTAILNEDGLCVTVVSPIGEAYKNKRDFALSINLMYGKNSFFLKGDSGINAENDMLASFGDYMDSSVLALNLSGGGASSAFLQKVSPLYAVIRTSGESGEESLTEKVLEITGASVLRTDVHGAVVFSCSGESIDVKTQR